MLLSYTDKPHQCTPKLSSTSSIEYAPFLSANSYPTLNLTYLVQIIIQIKNVQVLQVMWSSCKRLKGFSNAPTHKQMYFGIDILPPVRLLWWDSLNKVQPMPASAIMMCSKILTLQGPGSCCPPLWLLRQSANEHMNHDKQLGTSMTLLTISSETCLSCCVTDCYGFRVFALHAGKERFYVC